jgi:hypothetical protein
MRHRERNYLFADFDLSDSLRANQAGIQEQVDRIPKDQFLNSPYDDVIEHLVSQNTIEPLTIYEDRIVASEPSECKIDVSGDPNRFIRDTSRPFHIPGHEISIEIPFSGDHNLLRAKTSTWSSVFPTGEIRQGRDGIGKIVMIFRQPHDADPNQIKTDLDRNLKIIKEYVGWSKSQVDAFNQSIPGLVKRAVDFRREKLKKQNSITDLLGIPLKPKSGTPSFEPIKVNKKITKPLPPPPKEGYKAEPGITDSDYDNILKLIRHSGSSFEKTPKTFSVHDEEELRDIILSQLNAVYEGEAKGETFNKSGKTDILISEGDRSAFIAECKIWRGQKSFSEAIDQLLSYLTWRDCKTALIVFNKNNKNFSQILESVDSTVSAHPNFLSKVSQADENEWFYKMRAKDDDTRPIKMNVMFFNIFCPEK